tara:strand:- start:389 stop:1177 length:789 start_codon:yes stop_codon:yes gene_type:complete
MNDPARNHLPSGGEYPTYFHLLADLHRRLRPARYLEIGVNEGHSLALSLPTTRLVGVDPEPRVGNLDHPDWTVVPTTSKDFFAYHDVMGLLGGLVDLAFVDGLHHFEVALADVLAIERYAHPGTVVLVHDVVPIDAPTSTRDRATLVWSGDVWKAVVLLRRYRPNLTITTLDVAPTGMALITGFEAYRADDREGSEDVPSRRDSDLWFDDAVASLLPATYADLVAMGPRALGTVPCTGQIVEECLARLPRPGPGSRTGTAQS